VIWCRRSSLLLMPSIFYLSLSIWIPFLLFRVCFLFGCAISSRYSCDLDLFVSFSAPPAFAQDFSVYSRLEMGMITPDSRISWWSCWGWRIVEAALYDARESGRAIDLAVLL
jgi:hypothetical protein